MSAWLSRESKDESGKRKYTKLTPGMKGIRADNKLIVFWRDPEQRLKQKRIATPGKPGKRQADDLAEKTNAQLNLGMYDDKSEETWKAFRSEFDKRCISAKATSTQRAYRESLDLFDTLIKPMRASSITTFTVDKFRDLLSQRRGSKPDSKISPAAVNKHLRSLRVALRKAHAWEYLPKLPQIEMAKEPDKLVVWMEADHFDDIYGACDVAKHPHGRAHSPGQWWQSLMLTGIMAGARINELLTLLWDDVHLDESYLIIRYNRSNKAKRDDVIPLHPVAVEHLHKITHFGLTVFDWPLGKRALYDQWHAIQREAGIELTCHEDHTCTPTCHVYGFHSLKKACGTQNAARLPEAALNAFMRHASGETTRKYYQNQRRSAGGVVDQMFVPKSAVKAS